MTHAARALTQAIRRRPDRYELRLDFEHDLYSVANVDRDSLDLDFTKRKYLAEQDPGAGAFDFSDLITHTRSTTATYRDANGVLQTAAIDEPRKQHYPAPRILSVPFADFFDTDTSTNYTPKAGAALSVVSGELIVTPDGVGNGPGFAISLGTVTAGKVYAFHFTPSTTGTATTLRPYLTTGIATLSGYPNTYLSGGNQAMGGALAVNDVPRVVCFTPTQTGEIFFHGIELGVSSNTAAWDAIFLQELSHADGENAGYLHEAPAMNLVGNSDPSQMGKTSATMIVPAAGDSPLGADTATRVASGVEGSALRRVNETVNVFAAGVKVVAAALVRAEALGFLGIAQGDDFVDAWFDIRTGEVGTLEPAVDHAEVEYWGAGWYFCWARFTSDATTERYDFYITDVDGNNARDIAIGDGILMAHVQVEEADQPSSLIRTSGAAVTRAADVANVDLGIAGVGGQPAFVFMDVTTFNPGGVRIDGLNPATAFTFSSHNTAGTYRLLGFSGQASSGTSFASGGNFPSGGRDRVAGSLVNGERRLSVNGEAVGVGAATGPQDPISSMRFLSNSSAIFHGVRFVGVGKTAAELIAESTP